MTTDTLTPRSYHLRNFGKYQKLDLEAATNGNLTLTGANTVGKTTLANAWFPVLVDGSIATPSFNPALSSDVIQQSTEPRNTMREKRTFTSMLLGWGPGAFKVRTGYTYMVLAAATRQVVLGIGAHRQSDGAKSATWWFVLDSADVSGLTCVDNTGASLSRADFVETNAQFGEALHVFTRWDDYRAFVAINVYGFDSGKTLGKLANAYRLLASPILTGGSARFAPIPIALREAQEPIDAEQIIRPLADSQRQLNLTLAFLRRLKDGQARLARIKRTLFWGNLNWLNAHFIREHVRIDAELETAAQQAVKAQQEAATLNRQITLVQGELEATQQQLQEIQERLAEQKALVEIQRGLDHELQVLARQIRQHQAQLAAVEAQKQTVQTRQKHLVTLQDQALAIQQNQLDPPISQIHALSSGMRELTLALAQTAQGAMVGRLEAYLQTQTQLLATDRQIEAAIKAGNVDVQLVIEMQAEMGTAIDTHANGVLMKPANTRLHEANQTIHHTGMTKMNAQVAALQQQQQELQQAHPDLAILRNHPDRFTQLSQLIPQAAKHLRAFQKVTADIHVAKVEAEAAFDQLEVLRGAIDENFSPAAAKKAMQETTARRDALRIDPTLKDQLKKVQKTRLDLQQTGDRLRQKAGLQEGVAETQNNRAARARESLAAVDQELEAALVVLASFAPPDIDVGSINSTLRLVRRQRAKIKQYPYVNLGETVRDLLQGREEAETLDALFKARGADELAAALHEHRTVTQANLTVVPFSMTTAEAVLQAGVEAVTAAVAERESGQSVALTTYLNAAVLSISQQYQVVPEYNELLTAGVAQDGIRLQIALKPRPGSTAQAVREARDLQAKTRPALKALVEARIQQLVQRPDLADDDAAFFAEAQALLDTRTWSDFEVTIYRRHADAPEVVNDAFVQSAGSGAEKAQAMVLPLLLVPKMRLRQASKPDAPHLVMFDEFADKLDPETAKAFAQTIDRFGFHFIATMPSGGQTKLLADGVANRAYEVLAPKQNDGRFHANQVQVVMTWQKGAGDESIR